jgi:hypothetical protein
MGHGTCSSIASLYDLDKLRSYARYHYRFMVDEEEEYVKKEGESHEL